jgi:hypothetical protein
MWKWLRRITIAVFVVIAAFAVAASAMVVRELHPISAFGRGIGHLAREEQIAYLMLIDQADAGNLRKQTKELPIAVYLGAEEECPILSPSLREALSDSIAFTGVTIVASECSGGLNPPFLFAEVHDEPYMGGVNCGGLCGGGHRYASTETLGVIVIYRVGSWIS